MEQLEGHWKGALERQSNKIIQNYGSTKTANLLPESNFFMSATINLSADANYT